MDGISEPRSSKPQFQRLRLAVGGLAGGPAISPGIGCVLVHPAFGTPDCAPVILTHAACSLPLAISACSAPRFDGREIHVIADEHQPVAARGDAIRPYRSPSAVTFSPSVYGLRPT